MRHNPFYELTDDATIRQLVRDNPFVTLVSSPPSGLVASHYPVMLDETRTELSVLGHVGRPDEVLHELGQHEILLIVTGPHGYVSPSWYQTGPGVPTWNFVVAHLSGVPELLTPEENFRALSAMVDVMEAPVQTPLLLESDPAQSEYAHNLSNGTVGFRLTPTRVVAKAKLSQNKPAEVVERVVAELAAEGPYSSPDLADTMLSGPRAAAPTRSTGRPASGSRHHSPPTSGGTSTPG